MATGLPNNEYHIDAAGHSTVLAGDNYGLIIVKSRTEFPAQDKEKLKKILLESLVFDRMDARIQNVSLALANTCQWLFTHTTFKKWFESSSTQEDGGFLWIKGYPGSGKSTIMKELVRWAGSRAQPDTLYTYFFNARSTDSLEKSSLGLLRSFTYQILSTHPRYRDQFLRNFAWKVRKDVMTDNWTKTELQNFLLGIVANENFPSATFFVDALDEGDDEDVRGMIMYLGQLTHHATLAGTSLRVCLSSRYYPHINIDHALSISIDRQAEHMRDIEVYVHQKLAGRYEEGFRTLHRMICDRSNGIFLWVILIVPILNRLNDEGKGIAIRLRTLEQIPQDLYKVFDEITARDWENESESTALFRWVLFTMEPLPAQSLHMAVQVSLRAALKEEFDRAALQRWMLYCSHGLIEQIDGGQATRFIHETVREYVLEKELHSGRTLDVPQHGPQPSNIPSVNGHMRLAEDCLSLLTEYSSEEIIGQDFFRYAASHWWHHIKASGSIPTEKVMTLSSKLLLSPEHFVKWWTMQHQGSRSKLRTRPWDQAVTDLSLLLSFAIDAGIVEITRLILDHGADSNGIHGGPLGQAVRKGDTTTVELLLDCGADANKHLYSCYYEASRDAYAKKRLHSRYYDVESPLGNAARVGDTGITNLLIDHGADVNATFPGPYHNSLQAAIAGGHEEIVQLLLRHRININTYERQVGMPLYNAAFRGHTNIVRLLLDHGADINAEGGLLGTALRAAELQNHDRVVRLLLERGANDVEGGGTYNAYPSRSAPKRLKQTFRSFISRKLDSKSSKTTVQ